MRRLQKGRERKRPRKKIEPLAEGIIPLKRNGQRDWASMNDDEIVRYARRFIEENGISSKSQLRKTDNGLRQVLGKRELLDRIGLENQNRDWASMSAEGIVSYAKVFIEENGIKNRKGLQKENVRLYGALRRMKLLDVVGFEKKQEKRDWRSMTDDEIFVHVLDFIKKKKIKSRSELKKRDCGLYSTLLRKNLLDKIGFVEKKIRAHGFFPRMSDEELDNYAKETIRKNGITSRSGLQKEDGGLYTALKQRNLLDRLEFKEKVRPAGFFKKMSDNNLIRYARNMIKKKKIKSRDGLHKEDHGLYNALWKRKLLGKLEFEEGQRDWASLSDDELVEYAKKFIKEKGVENRSGLLSEDVGFYRVLKRRKLLDNLEFEKRLRDWASMNNNGLVEYAKKFIKEKGVENRSGLKKEDCGLYGVLRERKLLDLVFAPIESQKKREAVQQVVEAMEEFS